jgi:hypothetical protein
MAKLVLENENEKCAQANSGQVSNFHAKERGEMHEQI